MLIGLHDSEMAKSGSNTKFPNYALMKISAYHKCLGDTVEWFEPLHKNCYDVVYSSKIFDYTDENLYLPENTIYGGTGYDLMTKLGQEIDSMFPDYTIYSDYDCAIGYITRGCPNNCRWCVVPAKEGPITPYRQVKELLRKDTNKLVLMDNNILASEFGINELRKISEMDILLDINQGMDIRLVTDEIIDILAKIKWLRFIRFSCDTYSQVKYFEKILPKLREKKLISKVFIYFLVTKDVDDAVRRLESLKKFKSINIYAQAERNDRLGIKPNKLQLDFTQRYVYSGLWRKISFSEYIATRGGRR